MIWAHNVIILSLSHKARGCCSLKGLALCQINPLIKSHYPLIERRAIFKFVGVISAVSIICSAKMFLSRWLLTNLSSLITWLIFLRFFLLSFFLTETFCQYSSYTYNTGDYSTGGPTEASTGGTDYPTYPDTTTDNDPPVSVTNPPLQTTLQPASSSLSGINSFNINDKLYGVIIPFPCSSRADPASPDHPPVPHSFSWDWRQPFLWLWLWLRACHPKCSSPVRAAESSGRIQFLSPTSLLYWGKLF